MKKPRKIILLLLVMVLVFAGISSCKPADKPDTVDSPTQEATEKPSDETTPEPTEEPDIVKDADGNIVKVNFPLKEQAVITVTSHAGFEDADPNDCPAVLWVEEETNIDFQYFTTADKEKAKLMLVSGEYTDFYNCSLLSSDDVINYGASGVLLDSNQYISTELTPNLYALYSSHPQAKGVGTAPDGGLYSLPYIIESEGSYQEFWYIMNEDMLAAVGMDTPTNMDEIYEFLKACKEQDANGNGLDDEIGLGFGGPNMLSFTSTLSIWGLPTKPGNYENLSYVEGGKVKFAMTTGNFQAAIRYYNKLYSEGLLDKESFTQDQNAMIDKINADPSIVAATMFNKDSPEGYTHIPPPDGTEGYTAKWYIHPGLYGNKNVVAVTDKSEAPEIIYAYLDKYHFDFYNSMKFYYGDVFMPNDDGTYAFDVYDGSQYGSTTEWIWKSGGYNAPCRVALKEDIEKCTNEELSEILVINPSRTNAYFNFGYSEVANQELWPRPYTATENVDELAAVKTDIFALCNQKVAEWITGDAGLMEQEWDQYVSDLNAMGLPRMLEILQQDYDVFVAGQEWK